MNYWHYQSVATVAQAYRTGWAGAWDAFKAALLRRNRLQVPTEIHYGFLVKGDATAYVAQGSNVSFSKQEYN